MEVRNNSNKNVYLFRIFCLSKFVIVQYTSAKETNEHFLIAPSILSADFARLGEEVGNMENSHSYDFIRGLILNAF